MTILSSRKYQYSLVIILPYFGELPWYFSLFLLSCKRNPSVNFCIITDHLPHDIECPANVQFLFATKAQVATTISEKFQVAFNDLKGCKICDYKPAFAHLFPEVINGYDFWGVSDMDLVYGNLRFFLTSSFLRRYDVMSFRPEYLTGPFTVFRNCEAINSLYLHSKDYIKAFSSEQYENFEECHFLFTPLQNRERIENLDSSMESMTHVVMKKVKEKSIRAHFDFNLLEGPVGNISWRNNQMLFKSRYEILLYHFLTCKDAFSQCPSVLPIKQQDVVYFTKKKYYKTVWNEA